MGANDRGGGGHWGGGQKSCHLTGVTSSQIIPFEHWQHAVCFVLCTEEIHTWPKKIYSEISNIKRKNTTDRFL